MKNFWKSFGWFWMSTVPMIACVALQIMAGIAAMAGYGMVLTLTEPGMNFGQAGFLEKYTSNMLNNMLKGAEIGVFAYHVIGIVVFGLWYYLYCCRKQMSGTSIFAPLGGKSIGLAVFLGIAGCTMSTQMVTVISYFLPAQVEEFNQMMEQAGFGTSILSLLAVIVLAPIGEEFLCRGLIQHYAGKITQRFFIVNTVQALMFGIMHMNWIQGTYAFCLGLLLGWLRYRYRSLLIPMIVHFVINFSSTLWLGWLLTGVPDILWVQGAVLLLAVWMLALGLIMVEKSLGGRESRLRGDGQELA